MILFVVAQLYEPTGDGPFDRGLAATRDLEPGRAVVRVPLEMTWRVTDWRMQCSSPKDLSVEATLAAMVAAAAPGTDLYDYVRSVSLVDVPRTWNEEDLELLPPPWLDRAKQQRRADSRAHRRLLRACSLHAPRRETFAWALGVVANRKYDMLVPVVDALRWLADTNLA